MIKLDKQPKVSVIVPVYNGDKYIRDTLLSILNQTYKNIECIVIDDGSTDRTIEVCQEFSSRLTILRKANGGQSSALNLGWSRASGDYLSYLSADDILNKTAIERLIRDAENVTGDVVVYPLYELINSKGEQIKIFQTLFLEKKSMFERFYCPVGPGAIFSRSLFERFGGWRLDLRQIPDFEYWLRLAGGATFVCREEILSSFRVHQDSQTYAVSDYKKSDESILVARSIVNSADGDNYNPYRFIAAAHVFSACLHLRSGRIFAGIRRLFIAGWYSPRVLLSMFSIKRIVSSCTTFLRYANRTL